MITPDNLDERLNRAFDNPVDYQFGIMLGGKRVYGRPDPLNHINMAYTGKNDRETKEVELSPEITAETAAADEKIANRWRDFTHFLFCLFLINVLFAFWRSVNDRS